MSIIYSKRKPPYSLISKSVEEFSLTTSKVFHHLISSEVSSHLISLLIRPLLYQTRQHNTTTSIIKHKHNHTSHPIHQSHLNNYDLLISCFQYLNIISQQNIININIYIYIYNIPLFIYIYIYTDSHNNHQSSNKMLRESPQSVLTSIHANALNKSVFSPRIWKM